MEKTRFLSFILVLAVLSNAFAFLSTDEPGFKISIAGVNHELKDGLNPSEFAKLTIESKDEKINVQSFEITLARGSRAISITKYEGNIVDLNLLKANARSGDRIVIDIKSMSIENESSSPANAIFVIKVN
jgi:hypothetical protein